jgi:hypothetical protein
VYISNRKTQALEGTGHKRVLFCATASHRSCQDWACTATSLTSLSFFKIGSKIGSDLKRVIKIATMLNILARKLSTQVKLQPSLNPWFFPVPLPVDSVSKSSPKYSCTAPALLRPSGDPRHQHIRRSPCFKACLFDSEKNCSIHAAVMDSFVAFH